MKIRYFKYIVSLLILTGWSDMKYQGQVACRDLPQPVQDTLYFMNEHSYLTKIGYMVDGMVTERVDWSLVDFTEDYTLSRVETLIGPWVSHMELKNIKTGKVHKLERGTPKPIIIYGSDMYIPTDYNIIGHFESETLYDHYVLK